MKAHAIFRALSSRSGFTLAEIMIVVGVIGLLAVIAVPSYMRARVTSRTNRFLNDLRVATAAFEQYNLQTGQYPPDCNPAIVPPRMSEFLTRFKWTDTTAIGGQWDWDFGQFGYRAGVSVYHPTADQSLMTQIDGKIDDGDLRTGRFRQRQDGYIYIIEQ